MRRCQVFKVTVKADWLLHHCCWIRSLLPYFISIWVTADNCSEILRSWIWHWATSACVKTGGQHFCRIKEAVYHSLVELQPKSLLMLAKLIRQSSFLPRTFSYRHLVFRDLNQMSYKEQREKNKKFIWQLLPGQRKFCSLRTFSCLKKEWGPWLNYFWEAPSNFKDNVQMLGRWEEALEVLGGGIKASLQKKEVIQKKFDSFWMLLVNIPVIPFNADEVLV